MSETETIESLLVEGRTFAPSDFVFREGDPGDDLYVIAHGTASVYRVDGEKSTRLVTFSEGTENYNMFVSNGKEKN